MRRLRAPDGCPWDREQTPASLRPFVLEETDEVLEAIEHGTPQDLCEELGDFVFEAVFLARRHEEAGDFSGQLVCAESRQNEASARAADELFGPAARRRSSPWSRRRVCS